MPLTDRRLAQLGAQHESIRQQIKELEAEKTRISDKIIEEMERRNTRQIDTNGTKITMAQNESVRYDFDGLAADLGTAKIRKVQKREVDPTLLAQEVQAGHIDAALVARNSMVKTSKPYIRVS